MNNILKRWKQIKENRNCSVEDNWVFVSSDEFMNLFRQYKETPRKYLFADDPCRARIGIVELSTEKQYLCDIEDFSEEQEKEYLEIKKSVLGA